jgi:hypothetical protein
MTHEERLRLIHKPFFIDTHRPFYRWAGANTGGYLFSDRTGGRHVSSVNEMTGKVDMKHSRAWIPNGFQEISSLYDAQRHVLMMDAFGAYHIKEFQADELDFNREDNE